MLQPLPAETVLEAKERSRRNTWILFFLLAGIYIVFFNLLVFASGAFLFYSERESYFLPSEDLMIRAAFLSTAAAFFFALIHFWIARAKPLEEILRDLSAKPADPKDDFHSKFVNVVAEAEAATGIRPIRAVVIPTTGLNAFSVSDSKNQSAIGVTEGLLAKLDRSELSAVAAHEAAHLAHEDSLLTATACSLSGVFDGISSFLSRSQSGGSGGRIRLRSSGRGALVQIVLLLIAATGRFLTKLIHMAISRSREYLADADAVQMCKDPLSLAEALHKISEGYRAGVHVPESYSAVFVVNPQYSHLDEESGLYSNLFSTHPPVRERIKKLLAWAKTDASVLKKEPEKMFAHHEGKWAGPHTPEELAALGIADPSNWIISPELTRANEIPALRELFEKKLGGQASKYECPRCRVALGESKYEGAPVLACDYCKGYLLKAGVLDRLIARRIQTFAPQEIESVKAWRSLQKGDLKNLCKLPHINCPLCGKQMFKSIHTCHTKVVIDRCLNENCGSIWCDAQELESIQMIVEGVQNKW